VNYLKLLAAIAGMVRYRPPTHFKHPPVLYKEGGRTVAHHVVDQLIWFGEGLEAEEGSSAITFVLPHPQPYRFEVPRLEVVGNGINKCDVYFHGAKGFKGLFGYNDGKPSRPPTELSYRTLTSQIDPFSSNGASLLDGIRRFDIPINATRTDVIRVDADNRPMVEDETVNVASYISTDGVGTLLHGPAVKDLKPIATIVREGLGWVALSK